MADILMTGADGVIGTILRHPLDMAIKPFKGDARKYDSVLQQAEGCRAIVHLAWNTESDNHQSDYADPENLAMAQNVLGAAAARKIKRVIFASSIHADMPVHEPGGLRSPYRTPEPDSPYGANKVAVEALSRVYARRKGLEVVCIRFGWVSPNINDKPDPTGPYPLGEGWLSHRDCITLVARCINAPQVPDNYAIVYGVSWRAGGVHDLGNPFDWVPSDKYTAEAG